MQSSKQRILREDMQEVERASEEVSVSSERLTDLNLLACCY